MSNGIIQTDINEVNGLVTLIPFLFLSYFVGHFISHIGKNIEKIYLKENAWIVFLEKNRLYAKELNELNMNIFDKSFLEGERIDSTKSGEFFDNAYNYLTIHQKKETFPILKAQYGFFRTATGLWLVLFIIFLFLSFYNCCIGQVNYIIVASTMISLLSIFISINRAKERKQHMYTKVYKVFISVNINPK